MGFIFWLFAVKILKNLLSHNLAKLIIGSSNCFIIKKSFASTDSLTSSFSELCFSSSCLNAMTRTILSLTQAPSCLVPNLKGKAFSISLLSRMLAVGIL